MPKVPKTYSGFAEALEVLLLCAATTCIPFLETDCICLGLGYAVLNCRRMNLGSSQNNASHQVLGSGAICGGND